MLLTKLSEKAVRHWFEEYRTHLPKDKHILEAIVQLDEAYFGGYRGWMLLMGRQKGTRKLVYTMKPNNQYPNRSDAFVFVRDNIKPGSLVCTDGSQIYRNLDQHVPVSHKSETHVDWEFKLTSEIEGTFGNLRTFIRRMYHHATPAKLPSIIYEFAYRFSHPEMFENPRFYLENTLTLVPIR